MQLLGPDGRSVSEVSICVSVGVREPPEGSPVL